MKPKLTEEFINWIGEVDPFDRNNNESKAKKAIIFLLNHCSCIKTIDKGYGFYAFEICDYEIGRMFPEDFIIRSLDPYHMDSYDMIIDFSKVFTELLESVCSRISDYEIERFLIEQV